MDGPDVSRKNKLNDQRIKITIDMNLNLKMPMHRNFANFFIG